MQIEFSGGLSFDSKAIKEEINHIIRERSNLNESHMDVHSVLSYYEIGD